MIPFAVRLSVITTAVLNKVHVAPSCTSSFVDLKTIGEVPSTLMSISPVHGNRVGEGGFIQSQVFCGGELWQHLCPE